MPYALTANGQTKVAAKNMNSKCGFNKVDVKSCEIKTEENTVQSCFVEVNTSVIGEHGKFSFNSDNVDVDSGTKVSDSEKLEDSSIVDTINNGSFIKKEYERSTGSQVEMINTVFIKQECIDIDFAEEDINADMFGGDTKIIKTENDEEEINSGAVINAMKYIKKNFNVPYFVEKNVEKIVNGNCKKVVVNKAGNSEKTKSSESSDDDPYQCDVCNKEFTQLRNLKLHTLGHTGERPHKCEICGKSFAVLGHLKRHMLLHTGEKPYQCDVCKKKFTQSYHLNAHKRVHTGETPFKCDVCNKFFGQPSNLRRHIFIHSGEKLHQCDVCEKVFTRLSNLKKT